MNCRILLVSVGNCGEIGKFDTPYLNDVTDNTEGKPRGQGPSYRLCDLSEIGGT